MTDKPDVDNIKKARLRAAAQVAATSASDVAPNGNPATAIGTSLATAWVSKPTADDFITDLTGVGTSAKNAFDDAHTHLQSLAQAEPDKVPHDDPRGNPANYAYHMQRPD